jgi:predicted RNase H-like nuclease (RuvC/YqgF family)
MNTQLQVAKAEAELKAAKAAQAAEERAVIQNQLMDVRGQIRTAQHEYEKLRRAIKRGENDLSVLQAHVDGLTNRITIHMQGRPDCADVLPDDPDVRVWQVQYDELQKQRNEAIARVRDRQAQMPNKMDAAKYEGNFGLLATLQRMETNLTRRLKGEPIGASWQGGVYRVL